MSGGRAARLRELADLGFSTAGPGRSWREFARRQLGFNDATGDVAARLSKRIGGLRDELEALEERLQALADVEQESGVAAVRAQVYDLEGSLRTELSALQIEIARLRQPPDA